MPAPGIQKGLFLPLGMLEQLLDEATRLDQSPSWCAQRAWSIARAVLNGHRDHLPDLEQHVRTIGERLGLHGARGEKRIRELAMTKRANELLKAQANPRDAGRSSRKS